MKSIIRTCIVSRQKYDRRELFRVVKDKDNNISLDLTYKKEGFGAYLLKDINIIKKSKDNNLLNRKLKINVPKEIYQLMIDELNGEMNE